MEKAKPHLSDLFRVGELVTVQDADENQYQIWVRRPTSLQMEAAREHANGRMGRHKRAARDPDSDIYVALHGGLEDLSREDLLTMRASFDEPEVREISFNEVLYSKEIGDDWETDDRYMAVLTGLSNRYSEIHKYNTEMEESGVDDRIVEDEDEQLQALLVEYNLFHEQQDERISHLMEVKKAEWSQKSDEELREEIARVSVNLEARMVWYEAYQIQMLYYACRYPDDTKKMYFSEAGEVLELPSYIRSQLYDAYERLEAGSDDVKNSLSLPSFSL